MKKSLKIVSIMMMAIMMIMVATPVFATNRVSYENAIKNLNPQTPNGIDDVQPTVSKILGLLQWVAIIGGIIVITILGIKYMMGSLEEKAEYKKSMIPLVVGCFVAMGATTIAKFLFNFI